MIDRLFQDRLIYYFVEKDELYYDLNIFIAFLMFGDLCEIVTLDVSNYDDDFFLWI